MKLEDLLIFADENGNIDLTNIQAELDDMKKRKEILEQHPSKIYYGKDGWWHTYLGVTKNGGRRLIKRKTKEELEDHIISVYETENATLLSEMFESWVDRQRNCGRCGNTILKYKSDWRKYMEEYPINEMPIDKIDEEVIGKHFGKIVKDGKITYKGLQSLFGYINGIFTYAVRKRLINENPCCRVDLLLFQKKCRVVVKNQKKRVLRKSDAKEVLQNIQDKHNKNENYIVSYAVDLSLLTGMRVSELAALKWECIDFDFRNICICYSEKRDRETNTVYIARTKTGKERYIPLTNEIAELLHRIKEIELQYGYYNKEFVFWGERGRATASAISNCGRRMTATSNCEEGRSIHAIRRTINSNMRCSGVSAKVAASILGHSEKVNENNYTEDIWENKEKLEAFSKAGLLDKVF